MVRREKEGGKGEEEGVVRREKEGGRGSDRGGGGERDRVDVIIAPCIITKLVL